MIRHQQRIQRARENAFNLTQRANEVLLPAYDALSDPYLAGYFDNPQLKRHLKETGVIKRKRRPSYKFPPGSPTRHALTERAGGEKRSKSLARSTNNLKEQVKLPLLEELLHEERAALSSSATTRSRNIYKSNNHNYQHSHIYHQET